MNTPTNTQDNVNKTRTLIQIDMDNVNKTWTLLQIDMDNVNKTRTLQIDMDNK